MFRLQTYQEEIPAIAHRIVIDEAVSATCTASGKTEAETQGPVKAGRDENGGIYERILWSSFEKRLHV